MSRRRWPASERARGGHRESPRVGPWNYYFRALDLVMSPTWSRTTVQHTYERLWIHIWTEYVRKCFPSDCVSHRRVSYVALTFADKWGTFWNKSLAYISYLSKISYMLYETVRKSEKVADPHARKKSPRSVVYLWLTITSRYFISSSVSYLICIWTCHTC
jgi:hypothetical protein